MQSSSTNPQSVPFTRKIWVRVLGAIIAVVILAVIIVPFFIDADTFRPKVQSELSTALGRPVTLGHLSFSLLSGSLVADNVTIADDPAFSASPFFAAKSLHIGVNTSELIFHRQVEITDITADSPEVHLISGQNSTWNYSSLGRDTSSNSQSSKSNLSVGELKITNGSVSVASQSSSAKPFVYDKVDLTVQHVSFATQMPFELAASLPGSGTLKLSGTAGPVAQPNVVNTPVQATFSVKHFDPVAAGVVEPGQGLSMIADVDGEAKSDGKTASATGKVQAVNLKLSPNGTPAPHTVDVDLNVTDDLGTNAGRISDIAVHTGSLAAHINGTYQMTGSNVNLNLHLAAPNLPVDGLIELLPAVGVKLPSGSSLHGGTLTANLEITGPAASPRIAGPIQIDNTQLAGFDLGSKIEGVTKPGASPTSGGTAIRTLRADVVNTAQGTQLSNIVGDVPSIGTASGGGTVASSGALNFQMLAKLSATGAPGSALTAASSATNSWLGAASGLLQTTASNGIPLIISGTTSSPSIRLDAGAMLKQQAGGLLNNKGKTNSNTKPGSLIDLGKSLLGGGK
jgi:AsmA protein